MTLGVVSDLHSENLPMCSDLALNMAPSQLIQHFPFLQ